MELCGIKALSFAVGLYLPLATTLPIFIGGSIRGIADWMKKAPKTSGHGSAEDELGKGSLFATGLVAGGALAGVIVALLSVNDNVTSFLKSISAESWIGNTVGPFVQSIFNFPLPDVAHGVAYQLVGVGFFVVMGLTLFMITLRDKGSDST